MGTAGATGVGRRATSRWVSLEPGLAPVLSPGGLAARIAAAAPGEQDRLLTALLRVAGADELAQLTVVAALAPRLGRVVAGWARAGVPSGELAELGSDVVSACWAAVAAAAGEMAAGGPAPPRPGLVLVDRAREPVRVERRRHRRHLPVPLEGVAAPAAGGPGGVELLAGAVTDAVIAGRLSVSSARLVYATRVAGLSVAETAQRLGCSPASVRTRRARAERRLTA